MRRITDLKLYTTICCSAPSELLVALALRHGDQIVEQCRALVLDNLPLLDRFMQRRSDTFHWVRPSAGPVGFAQVLSRADVSGWCETLAARAGVLLLPGAVYGEPEHVRFGFGRANLARALERLEEHLG